MRFDADGKGASSIEQVYIYFKYVLPKVLFECPWWRGTLRGGYLEVGVNIMPSRFPGSAPQGGRVRFRAWIPRVRNPGDTVSTA